MSNRRNIFHTILTQYLSTFGSHFSIALSNADNDPKVHQVSIDYYLSHFVFTKFPRVIPLYKEIIINMGQLADTDTEVIVSYLTKAMKEMLTNHSFSIFAPLQNICVNFDGSNELHREILYYFGLYLISDLMCQIVGAIDCSSSINSLTKAAYNLVITKQSSFIVHKNIIQQWSIIFSILSEKNFEPIYQLFSMFPTDSDMTCPIILYRFFRLDADEALGPLFFNNIISIIRQYLKKKNLNNHILESVLFLLISLPYNEEIYQKLYNLIYPLRSDKNLSNGANLVLVGLYIRYNAIKNKAIHFFNKRVLGGCGDKSKTETCLTCFQVALLGRNVELESFCWGYGYNPKSTHLTFLKYSPLSFYMSQDSDNSFHSLFMNNFFVKSDFSVCPIQFSYALVQLASLDFQSFMNNIIPKFLSLNPHDSRFIVFLNTVTLINSDEFYDNCFSKVTKNDIKKFNLLIRDKAIETLLSIEPANNEPHGVCVREFHFLLDSLADECDSKINDYLIEWNMSDYFKPSNHSYQRCKHLFTTIDLPFSLIPSLTYLLEDEDYSNKNILRVLIKFACSINNSVASCAYQVCTSMFPIKSNPEILIEVAYSIYLDSESDFVIHTIVFELLKTQRLTKKDEPLLRKIEAIGLIIQSCPKPVLRSLGNLIVTEVNEILGEGSLMSIIEREIPNIEQNAKQKMMICVLPDLPKAKLPPATTIPFHKALLSHYYEVWLFFYAEVINTVMQCNFTPFINFINQCRNQIISMIFEDENKLFAKWSAGDMIILLSTQFSIPLFIDSPFYDSDKLYEPFNLDNYEDKRPAVCKIVNSFLNNEKPKYVDYAFSFIRHLHFTLLPSLLEVFAKVPSSLFPRVCSLVSYIIRSPDMTKKFFKKNIQRITNFMTEVQFYFLRTELSTSRRINWTDELEHNLFKSADLIRDFCFIVFKSISEKAGEISEIEWPIATREMMVRFFLNWGTTKSKRLESMRLYSDLASSAVAAAGPFLTSAPQIDENLMNFFVERSRKYAVPMIYNILHFHFELLLKNFLQACLILPRKQADLYFSCICDNLNSESSGYILKTSGELLFTASLYFLLKHPKALLFVKFYMRAVKDIEGYEFLDDQINNITFEKVPDVFCFATEAVFKAFFDALELESIRVVKSDIIKSVQPWVKNLRLLPKSNTCANDIPNVLNFFTPNEFLEKLIETTEQIGDDNMRSIVEMWLEIGKSPDHSELIPIFLSDWKSTEVKNRMFEILCELESDISFRIDNRYSFAYYFYVTKCLNKSFLYEQTWLGAILWNNARNVNGVNNQMGYTHFGTFGNATQFIQFFATNIEMVPIHIIHFVFLFHDKGTRYPFNAVCHALKIQNYQGQIPQELFRSIVDQSLKCFSDSQISNWGNEALKWIFGCEDLSLASISFLIYNRIKKPFHPDLIKSVIRIVSYHLEKNPTNIYEDKKWSTLLCNFLTEVFIFLSHAIEIVDDESSTKLVFKFVCAFLDCRVFVESVLVEATPIFLRYIRSKFDLPNFLMTDKSILIPIMRPRLSILEKDKESQNLLEEFIKITKNDFLKSIGSDISTIPDLISNISNTSKRSPQKIPNLNNPSSKNPSKRNYEELLMMALPIKLCYNRLFPSTQFFDDLNTPIHHNEEENSIEETSSSQDTHSSQENSSSRSSREANSSRERRTSREMISSRETSSSGETLSNKMFSRDTDYEKVDAFIDRISEAALCMSLVNYSMMIPNASYRLQNEIFQISEKIVQKINHNENNKLSLAKLYQQALRTMTRSCPKALDFMKIICRKIPDISSITIFDYYEWERSIEDVNRNIILIKNTFDPLPSVTMTDCKSYTNVIPILFGEKIPQILPFSANEKMKNGMKLIKRRLSIPVPSTKRHSRKTRKKSKEHNNFYRLPNSVSVVFGEDDKVLLCNLPPLFHPKAIINEEISFESIRNKRIRISPRKFLESESELL
ncbi:hypothetical protein TRFO_36831 [Tritrichomonas foetus]|uniref:Uncharacterized protein n=1 Tax=Tritrichomonas foetus TaxID=1144522 RepID=A0A1J4JFF7_9EUKA|nr:hypothetical protein TRFO_36831 [Tritrichomonas foetus]|eukprot:OHS97023.1 hypothetical protein TRFO_36831 [Tritrichomonas foetus]